MRQDVPMLGLGIGWRPELALPIHRRKDLGFVEILAEDVAALDEMPLPIQQLRRRSVAVIPHGVSLSLGGTEPLGRDWLKRLARLAEQVKAPLVSEHIAFVRAGGIETGHLLPLPRTRESIELLVSRIRESQAALPVPLALENIAALFEWPENEMNEGEFLTEIFDRTDALLLLDIENVYANARNHGCDPGAFLDGIPLERLAYVHIAGGIERDGLYHDTHAHAVPKPVLELLTELCRRTEVPGVMLERDDHFPSDDILNAELDAILDACGGKLSRHADDCVLESCHPGRSAEAAS